MCKFDKNQLHRMTIIRILVYTLPKYVCVHFLSWRDVFLCCSVCICYCSAYISFVISTFFFSSQMRAAGVLHSTSKTFSAISFCVRFLLIYTNSIDYDISHWQAILLDSNALLCILKKKNSSSLIDFLLAAAAAAESDQFLFDLFWCLSAELLSLWSVSEI